MRRNTLIFVLLSSVGLLSCTKESEKGMALNTSERHLVKITEVNGMTTTITTLTYNEKRQLSTIKTGSELTTYFYTDDKLTSMDVNDGYLNTVSEITYKDNYPSKGVTKIYTAGVLKRTLNLDYISSLSQTGQINIFETGSNTRRHYYEYDNANIISEVEIANRAFINYDFEYGEKKNVFFNASIRWPLAIEKFDRVSTNEILTIKTESRGVKHQRSFSYVYDTDGMPLSAVVTDTDPPSKLEYKSAITYSYEYL
ncbi:MAG: hypothetical protein H7223_02915 [Pedobacter sp.]|nr:hypothetical protein [Pedobacter sp.]